MGVLLHHSPLNRQKSRPHHNAESQPLNAAATDKVRVLMRAEKTLRVRANHPLNAGLELKPHAGSDRAFTYFTPDWSEDPETGVVEQRNELFAFRFANAESELLEFFWHASSRGGGMRGRRGLRIFYPGFSRYLRVRHPPPFLPPLEVPT